MPFDNSPLPTLSLYDRLAILLELLPTTGDQSAYCTCLWHAVRDDERLVREGVSGHNTPTLADFRLFGPNAVSYFSGVPTPVKGRIIEEDMKQLRAYGTVVPFGGNLHG